MLIKKKIWDIIKITFQSYQSGFNKLWNYKKMNWIFIGIASYIIGKNIIKTSFQSCQLSFNRLWNHKKKEYKLLLK